MPRKKRKEGRDAKQSPPEVQPEMPPFMPSLPEVGSDDLPPVREGYEKLDVSPRPNTFEYIHPACQSRAFTTARRPAPGEDFLAMVAPSAHRHYVVCNHCGMRLVQLSERHLREFSR